MSRRQPCWTEISLHECRPSWDSFRHRGPVDETRHPWGHPPRNSSLTTNLPPFVNLTPRSFPMRNAVAGLPNTHHLTRDHAYSRHYHSRHRDFHRVLFDATLFHLSSNVPLPTTTPATTTSTVSRPNFHQHFANASRDTPVGRAYSMTVTTTTRYATRSFPDARRKRSERKRRREIHDRRTSRAHSADLREKVGPALSLPASRRPRERTTAAAAAATETTVTTTTTRTANGTFCDTEERGPTG